MLFKDWIIFELFNSSYDFHWTQSEHDTIATFDLDNDEYRVYFEKNYDEHGENVHIWFGTKRRGVYLTGKNQSIEVMSRVVAAIRSYITREKPATFYFLPESSKRARLFDSIIKRQVQGYTKSNDYSYTYVRNDLLCQTNTKKSS